MQYECGREIVWRRRSSGERSVCSPSERPASEGARGVGATLCPDKCERTIEAAIMPVVVVLSWNLPLVNLLGGFPAAVHVQVKDGAIMAQQDLKVHLQARCFPEYGVGCADTPLQHAQKLLLVFYLLLEESRQAAAEQADSSRGPTSHDETRRP